MRRVIFPPSRSTAPRPSSVCDLLTPISDCLAVCKGTSLLLMAADPDQQLRKGVLGALQEVPVAGGCAGGGLLTTKVPKLSVQGLEGGPLKLPLGSEAATALAQRCEVAPFGQLDRTLVDRAVRDTLQLDAARLSWGDPAGTPCAFSRLRMLCAGRRPLSKAQIPEVPAFPPSPPFSPPRARHQQPAPSALHSSACRCRVLLARPALSALLYLLPAAEWEALVADAVVRAKRALGLPPDAHIEARPYKLLLYEKVSTLWHGLHALCAAASEQPALPHGLHALCAACRPTSLLAWPHWPGRGRKPAWLLLQAFFLWRVRRILCTHCPEPESGAARAGRPLPGAP